MDVLTFHVDGEDTAVDIIQNTLQTADNGIGIGLGFTFALTLLGGVRELLGTGKIFSFTVFPENYGALVFVLAPGAFIALGYLIALINKLKKA